MGANGFAKWRPAGWAREPRVYCGYCRASWPGATPPAEAVRHLREEHGVALTSLGVDLWQGDRYGPGTGAPRWRCGRPGTTRRSKRSGNAAGGAAVEPR